MKMIFYYEVLEFTVLIEDASHFVNSRCHKNKGGA